MRNDLPGFLLAVSQGSDGEHGARLSEVVGTAKATLHDRCAEGSELAVCVPPPRQIHFSDAGNDEPQLHHPLRVSLGHWIRRQLLKRGHWSLLMAPELYTVGVAMWTFRIAPTTYSECPRRPDLRFWPGIVQPT